jgi:DNA polymerase-3 subunit beta
LAEALRLAGRAVPGRTTVPVMKHLLLDAEDGTLLVGASNGTYKLTVDRPCAVEEPGTVTVPGDQFVKYATSLPDGPVAMHMEDRELHVKAGMSKAHFTTIDADKFPELPRVLLTGGTRVAAARLQDALRRVRISASTDDSHPTLRGVYVARRDDGLYLAAADGFRASRTTVPCGAEGDEWAAIVPNETVDMLLHLSGTGDWQILADGRHRWLTSNAMDAELSVVLDSAVVSGNFLDVERLILPVEKATTTVSVPVAPLREALQRALIFGKGADNFVRLDVWEDGVEIWSRDDAGGGRSQVTARVEGEAVSVGLNGRYLDDYLLTIGVERVEIYVQTPQAPVLFKEAGEDALAHVVMPMHLR